MRSFYSAKIAKHYSGDQIRNNWMGGAWGTYGEENFTEGMVEKLDRKRNTLVDLGVNGSKILT
jgi:hypothetical protein